MRIFVILFFSVAVMAQEAAQKDAARVYVSDSQSWQMTGGSGGSGGIFGAKVSGGARPQTAEVIKTLGQKCPDVKVNNIREKADYVILFDHEGGKGFARKDNKIAVFNKDGDSIISKSTMSLGGAVEDACTAVRADWQQNAQKYRAQAATPAAPHAMSHGNGHSAAAAPELKGAKLSVASTPAGADIEVDGAFVGNTPSHIDLTPGDHQVMVKKSGYKDWQRKIRVSGGTVTIAADLEKK
jgi:hypothetical protein